METPDTGEKQTQRFTQGAQPNPTLGHASSGAKKKGACSAPGPDTLTFSAGTWVTPLCLTKRQHPYPGTCELGELILASGVQLGMVVMQQRHKDIIQRGALSAEGTLGTEPQ